MAEIIGCGIALVSSVKLINLLTEVLMPAFYEEIKLSYKAK